MSGSLRMTVSVRADFEWVLDGRHNRRDAMDAPDVAFELADVVRVPASWKHKRNYEGYYWAATTASHVWFESLYERAALMRLDRDGRVAGLASQPMWIHWPQGHGKHAPDFFVRYHDGGAALIDVRPAEHIGDDDRGVPKDRRGLRATRVGLRSRERYLRGGASQPPLTDPPALQHRRADEHGRERDRRVRD